MNLELGFKYLTPTYMYMYMYMYIVHVQCTYTCTLYIVHIHVHVYVGVKYLKLQQPLRINTKYSHKFVHTKFSQSIYTCTCTCMYYI